MFFNLSNFCNRQFFGFVFVFEWYQAHLFANGTVEFLGGNIAIFLLGCYSHPWLAAFEVCISKTRGLLGREIARNF